MHPEVRGSVDRLAMRARVVSGGDIVAAGDPLNDSARPISYVWAFFSELVGVGGVDRGAVAPGGGGPDLLRADRRRRPGGVLRR